MKRHIEDLFIPMLGTSATFVAKATPWVSFTVGVLTGVYTVLKIVQLIRDWSRK